jgi:uncharacterized membrane protein YphA (DoxX/SURF4 family)
MIEILAILLLLIGVAFLLAILVAVVLFLGCLLYILAVGSYKTIKYKTWTEEGRERLKRDSAL